MDKIKLTVEQDNRIKIVSDGNREVALNCHIDGWQDSVNVCLNSLKISEMARILYEPNSYVVEPEFKIDDWVVYTHDNSLWKIAGELYGGKIHYEITKTGKHKGSVHKDHIRLATKEEIIFAELGREVGEFKAGDVTITINDSPYLLENKDVLAEKDEYINGRLKGFYPAESFIKIPL